MGNRGEVLRDIQQGYGAATANIEYLIHGVDAIYGCKHKGLNNIVNVSKVSNSEAVSKDRDGRAIH